MTDGPFLPGQARVGFIGTGVMGMPMARNLLKAGYRLTVHDLDEAALAEIGRAGADTAATVAEVARAVDVLITMLPDAPDVRQAALGPGGIAEAGEPGLIYVDMSTIDPATSREVNAALAERGIAMIDSPVARGVDHARAGTLALMVGGDSALLSRVEPVLRCMAEVITHCGPAGSGVAMKLVNNCLSHGIVAVSAEALALGAKAGLSIELMLRVSGATGTRNRLLHEVLPGTALQGKFAPGFASRLARKDQALAMGYAEALGISLPICEAVLDVLTRTRAAYPNDDFTSMLRVVEAGAGVELRCAREDENQGNPRAGGQAQ